MLKSPCSYIFPVFVVGCVATDMTWESRIFLGVGRGERMLVMVMGAGGGGGGVKKEGTLKQNDAVFQYVQKL